MVHCLLLRKRVARQFEITKDKIINSLGPYQKYQVFNNSRPRFHPAAFAI